MLVANGRSAIQNLTQTALDDFLECLFHAQKTEKVFSNHSIWGVAS